MAAFVLRAGVARARGASCVLGWPRAAPPLRQLPHQPAPHPQLAGARFLAGRAPRAQTFASWRARAPLPAARSSTRAPRAVSAAARLPAAAPHHSRGTARRGLLLDAFALPPQLAFEAMNVGNAEIMVATLPDIGGDADGDGDDGGGGGGGGAPIFLTPAELAGLTRFVGERRSDTPQMLMLTGTIKSGKSRVLNSVLPGLLAARLAKDPRSRRPVIFLHSFPLGAPAYIAARDLVGELIAFGESLGLELTTPPNALDRLPPLLLQLAKHVHARGGELWLLFDELQAPVVASTPADASYFVAKLKRTVELCSPFARIVGTGSGMVSLLSAVRNSAPNGFALWDAVSHVSLGSEPPAPVALAMAKRILASYARWRSWPEDFAALLTPQRACDELARSTHGELTSPRPALVAYLAGLVGDARGGTPEAVLEDAVRAMLSKLKEESMRDTLTALIRMDRSSRRWLRALAEGGPPEAKLRERLLGQDRGWKLVKFSSQLCEAAEPLPVRAMSLTTPRSCGATSSPCTSSAAPRPRIHATSRCSRVSPFQ
jgi:hypothetical protein